MAELPLLKGCVSKDMVKKIGSGSYAAEYVPWSKIAELMQIHAPGWMPNCITADDGSILHRAPVGAYLMIQFVHLDGTETPAYPQAVQDNRHKSIPYEKITSRDITDTQRRGWCLAAAAVFGIGVEMWTRDPLESGYHSETTQEAPAAPKAATKAPTAAAAKASEPLAPDVASEATFREAALEQGIHTVAIDTLVAIVGDKLGGDFEKGLGVLASKSADELNAKYAPSEAGTTSEQW
jgi:pyruvate/2-oxoglutarate dehydrogenase complex dihydrolipoamide acyltransferase (E2) component